jgi:hypothetical protein
LRYHWSEGARTDLSCGAMSSRYVDVIDYVRPIEMTVEHTTRGREVVDYAVVLVVGEGRRAETIRLYDGAHGRNEMHRYTTSTGKQSGIAFHSGTLGEGMRVAIEEIRHGYRQMIEGWERQ